MTPPATQTAWKGHPLLHLGGRVGGQREEDRGDPGGSMMTQVRKREPKTATSNMGGLLALRERVEQGGRPAGGAGSEPRRPPARGSGPERPPRDLPYTSGSVVYSPRHAGLAGCRGSRWSRWSRRPQLSAGGPRSRARVSSSWSVWSTSMPSSPAAARSAIAASGHRAPALGGGRVANTATRRPPLISRGCASRGSGLVLLHVRPGRRRPAGRR